MQASERVQVPGSERRIDPAHDRVGDVDPTEPIDVTVYLRPTAAPDWVDAEAAKPPTERRIVSRGEWAAAFEADLAGRYQSPGGGGFSTTDLSTCFQGLGVTEPSVTAVGIDGATSSPGTDPNADGEVITDAGAMGVTITSLRATSARPTASPTVSSTPTSRRRRPTRWPVGGRALRHRAPRSAPRRCGTSPTTAPPEAG